MNNDTEDDANYGLRYRVTVPLNLGDYFRIGIKANTDNFVRHANAGGFIAVSSVSWTTFDAQGGRGFNGSFSVAYNIVYRNIINPVSG